VTGGAAPGPDAWLRAQAEILQRWVDAPVAAMQELARLLDGSRSADRLAEALRDFGARFFAGAAASWGTTPAGAWASPPGKNVGEWLPPEAAAGGWPPPGFAGGSAPPLGPAREHLQRAANLAAALQQLAAAQQAQAVLLFAAGQRAGAEFAARVTARAAAPEAQAALGARAAFDLWIDCAEAAWLDLAHGEGWCAAQARTFDAALRVRACQQAIADDAARLAGVPTRAEVDELQRRVRQLERAACATPAPAARASSAGAGAEAAPRARPRRTRKPSK
jgi:hypothetical protein